MRIFAVFTACAVVAMSFCVHVAAQPKGAADEAKNLIHEVEIPQHGVAVLIPTKGSEVRGVVMLDQQEDGLRLTGKVVGLSPGKHGFHIHQFGDLRDAEGKSAGGHFNPGDEKHGGPDEAVHHAGDLGNIEANDEGIAEIEMTAPWLKLHAILGRGIVVHAGADDLTSQPSGAAGGRAAVGVIGIAEKAK